MTSPTSETDVCPACGSSGHLFPLPTKRKSPDGDHDSARVDAGDERAALREALQRGRETIEDLYRDLDEERSASSTAANEAMSMILRLQREKAEIQMESRQFRQFAEEKIAHDSLQIASLEDECLRREEAIEAVLHQIHAYRNRLLALGIDPDSSPDDDPPPPRCFPPSDSDLDRPETLDEIAHRISEMERGEEVMDKTVVELESSLRHSRSTSSETVGSFPTPEIHDSAGGGGDRVYTVDEGDDIRKLCARLQALEADRESLKKEIVSMRTEKAQMVLLKEIAENLSKGIGAAAAASPPQAAVEGRARRKDSPFLGIFSFLSSVKATVAPAIGLFLILYWRATSRR